MYSEYGNNHPLKINKTLIFSYINMSFFGNTAVKTLVSGRRRESEQTVRVVFVLFYKTFWADGVGDAPTEFYKEKTFIAGVETPACVLTSRRDLRLDYGYCVIPLSYFARHFGRVGGVTLLWSSIRNNTFYTGTPPFGLHFASQEIGRRLGRDYACITLRSACSDIPVCVLTFRRDLCLGEMVAFG